MVDFAVLWNWEGKYMDKRFAFSMTVLMVMVALVPALAVAEPTRAGDAELTDLMFDGSQASTEEFASGNIYISVEMTNTGGGEFIDWVDYTLNITYASNDTVLLQELIAGEMVYIPADSQAVVELINLTMEEGEYNVRVNTTIGINDTEVNDTLVVMDVVDMSVTNVGFDEGPYGIGDQIIPMCNVSYEGNVLDYADTLEVNLIIDVIGEASVTVYDETIGILTPASPGVDPGKNWMVSFPAWTPNVTGDFEATFLVYYDNYNESNNMDVISLNVENPVAVEGYALTDDQDPIPGVLVVLSTSPEREILTDDTGYYSFMNVSEGNYTIQFTKKWVVTYEANVTIVPGETKMVNATMTPLMVGGLRGFVTLPDSRPAQGALVVVNIPAQPLFTINTNSTGFYQIEDLPAGNATVTASLSGYVDVEEEIVLASQTWNELDLQLGEIPFNVSFSVPDGEPAFPIMESVSVFFTRPVERSSVDDSTLVLRKLTTATKVDVIYSFTDSDETVVITPSEPLDHSTDYQIEVTSWIIDINGDYFPGPVTTTFTTESEIIEVLVESTYPEDDGNEIPIDASISAKFSVPMDASTINGTTFKLFAQGGVVISGSVSYQASTWTAYLEPASDLDYGTRYSVTLDPDIRAQDPDYVFYGESWSFETEVLVNTGTLKGRILDENQEPFSPSQVTILLETGVDTTWIRQPQADGTFEIIDMDEGIWTITVKVPGYNDHTQQVNIGAGETTEITEPIVLQAEGTAEQEGDDLNIWIFVVIAFIIIFLLVVFWLIYNKRQEPLEVEELERRPAFGRERREPMYQEPYGGLAEGEFLCPACGSVVEGEDVICPACGAEFEEDLFECPECGASISADAEECPECGAIFEEEGPEEEEEEEFYDEEEEIDITEDFEVEDIDEDEFPISEVE
ncbi:MAG: carboxypeptidase regulatory-like domain-containing protein [Thermoplasmatota archaeon]